MNVIQLQRATTPKFSLHLSEVLIRINPVLLKLCSKVNKSYNFSVSYHQESSPENLLLVPKFWNLHPGVFGFNQEVMLACYIFKV